MHKTVGIYTQEHRIKSMFSKFLSTSGLLFLTHKWCIFIFCWFVEKGYFYTALAVWELTMQFLSFTQFLSFSLTDTLTKYSLKIKHFFKAHKSSAKIIHKLSDNYCDNCDHKHTNMRSFAVLS